LNHKEFETGWKSGLPETPCGSGSRIENTAIQREWIPRIVEKYGIESIADIGAGDLNWSSRTAFGCGYTAHDLIPRTQGVAKFDILTDKMPDADCLMVLWLINHLTRKQAQHVTYRLLHSKSRYLLTTWREGLWNFIDSPVLESVDIGNGAEIRLIEL